MVSFVFAVQNWSRSVCARGACVARQLAVRPDGAGDCPVSEVGRRQKPDDQPAATWTGYRLLTWASACTHTHTHPLKRPFVQDYPVSRYQKGKTNLDFTEARDSERQWHQLGHMQVSTLLQTDIHANTSPLSFLQAGCPSCPQPTASKHWRHQASTIPHVA